MHTSDLTLLFINHRFAIMLGVFVIIFIVSFKFKKGRHQRRIKTSLYVYNKLKTMTPAQRFGYLRKIDPYAFEELLLTALQRKGLEIVRNPRYSGDGGIDGKFYYKGELYLVQAKRYQGPINYQHVETFSSQVINQNCFGIFCHTGKTPRNMKQRNIDFLRIKIISGDKLLKLFDEHENIDLLLS